MLVYRYTAYTSLNNFVTFFEFLEHILEKLYTQFFCKIYNII